MFQAVDSQTLKSQEDAGKKKASRARPKAKAPGSNRARPILGPPRHVNQALGAVVFTEVVLRSGGQWMFSTCHMGAAVTKYSLMTYDPGHTRAFSVCCWAAAASCHLLAA